jgi:Mediator of CRAC channel activity.
MTSILFNDQIMWETKCRQEDMQQRALENERRAIDDARRAVDEKAQQLKSLSNQSALIAGFTMVVIVEIQIPYNLHPALLISFGCTTALVVCLMLISMLNATFLLVSILRYDTVGRALPFEKFWKTRCESDWKLALRAFVFGVPLFCLDLALIGWVKLWDFDGWAWIWASGCISVIAILTILVYVMHTDRKWREWLLTSEMNLVNQ